MRAAWICNAAAGLMLCVLVGCRTQPPNLKPPDGREELTPPPAEARFNYPSYPKEAFNNRDPLKKLSPSQEIMQTKGPSGPGAPGFGPGGQMR